MQNNIKEMLYFTRERTFPEKKHKKALNRSTVLVFTAGPGPQKSSKKIKIFTKWSAVRDMELKLGRYEAELHFKAF